MWRLMNYARKEAARFERTFSAGTPNARAAEAMGTISSIMGAIHKELPPNSRQTRRKAELSNFCAPR